MFDGMFLGCHHADIAESRLPGLDAALSDAPIGCGSIDCLGLVLWQCFHGLISFPFFANTLKQGFSAIHDIRELTGQVI
jgi:hypothetical protein